MLEGKNLNPKAACLKRREEEKAKALTASQAGDALGAGNGLAGEDFDDKDHDDDDDLL